MGFFDSLFGKKEKEKKPDIEQREVVHVDEVINALEKKGINVTGETGGFEDKILIKPIDLESEVGIDAGRNELLRGNLVIFDTRTIMNNKTLVNDLLTKVLDMVTETHGDIRRISEDKYLAVPPGYKFVSRPKKEEE